MLRADRRIVVSNVGSLVRPPAMIPYLEKNSRHRARRRGSVRNMPHRLGRRGGAASGRSAGSLPGTMTHPATPGRFGHTRGDCVCQSVNVRRPY